MNDSPSAKTARDRLILDHLRSVRWWVVQHYAHRPDLHDDLVGVGYLVLCRLAAGWNAADQRPFVRVLHNNLRAQLARECRRLSRPVHVPAWICETAQPITAATYSVVHLDFAAADLKPLVEAVDAILRSDPPSGHYVDTPEVQSA